MAVQFALPESKSLSQPPSIAAYVVDRTVFVAAAIGALAIIALVAYILWEIGGQALPAIGRSGAAFLVSTRWDVQNESFGILPQIWGTLYSSLLALLIGGFVGITIAIFLTQDFLPHRIAVVFRTLIEMLAAIPSVVFGLWGIFVVIPFIRPAANWLHDTVGFIPFFGTSLSGPGLAPAVIVLAIMILPTVTAISQDAIGLALGETMALAMLIGNANQISLSLFSPANTLASLLASNFPEAGLSERQALMYAALVLLAIALIVNVIGTLILVWTSRNMAKT